MLFFMYRLRPDIELNRAVASENASGIEEIIKYKRANPNQPDVNGLTALHHAARKGCLPVMRVLLEHAVQVHLKDNLGQTPLHYAAGPSPECVALLIESGASVNARSILDTPLHRAVSKGPMLSMQALLDPPEQM